MLSLDNGMSRTEWKREESNNMKLTIKIDMDNSAFEERKESEVNRILMGYCEALRTWDIFTVKGKNGNFLDSNGNTCGSWKVTG
jgi:hypothetical protein